ncbi:Alpha/Beta hydrolase protein [Triangularia verruculosa]|uniref:Alpha/Beta hydrolase protein n=1 Tax=Triangularia verruculosa TaxID=2587418 RepID=A0AAN7AQY7_9PEZI|nr:Alpha/Beta hydrolase protein [Triangularia verruculosa]
MASTFFLLAAFLGVFTTLISAQSSPFEMVTLIKIDYSRSELAEQYHRLDITYKTVNTTAIKTAVLVPKKLASSKKKTDAPVAVHLHGGGLIIGTNPDPVFVADWLVQLPVAENAILVSPLYRLLPEADALETLDDISSFWSWLHASLPGVIASNYPKIRPNLDQIVTVGESAGGYLAVQSALLFQDKAKIKAVIAQYPAIWPDLEAWKTLPVPDPTSETVIKAGRVIDEYLGNLTGTEVRVDAPYPDRWELTEAGLLSGRSFEFWGNETAIVQSGLGHALNVSKQWGDKLPGIWVLQGENDGMVAKAGTEEFIARLKAVHPKVEVKYTLKPGLHGFDALYGLDKPFIADGIKWTKKFWLQGKK